MKVSGKGIVAILAFTILVPLLVDFVLSLLAGNTIKTDFGISKFLLSKYIQLLPWYTAYTALMFLLIKIFNRYKNRL